MKQTQLHFNFKHKQTAIISAICRRLKSAVFNHLNRQDDELKNNLELKIPSIIDVQ